MKTILSREATVARPGFSRWLVPPAAIAVHMCIGQVYGFSVFNVILMDHFRSADSSGVAQAFLAMAGLYSLSMLFGAIIVRVPAPGWSPPGWSPPPAQNNTMVTGTHVSVDRAWRTPQFWLLWVVLCMNVSAGIGILGQASKMSMDMFGATAAIGGGFAGLLLIGLIANLLVRPVHPKHHLPSQS